MQFTSSSWMEVTGDVPEPSRLIVPNSLSGWGITAKGSEPGGIQPSAHFIRLTHPWVIFSTFAGSQYFPV
jgi:hypothetical protein